MKGTFPYAKATLPSLPSGLSLLISPRCFCAKKYSVRTRVLDKHCSMLFMKHVFPKLLRPAAPKQGLAPTVCPRRYRLGRDVVATAVLVECMPTPTAACLIVRWVPGQQTRSPYSARIRFRSPCLPPHGSLGSALWGCIKQSMASQGPREGSFWGCTRPAAARAALSAKIAVTRPVQMSLIDPG